MQTPVLFDHEPLRVIGLMSGTSADGVDAALVEITGCGTGTRLVQKGFVSIPYEEDTRRELLALASGSVGGSRALCLMNFRLGELFADACEAVCEQAGILPAQVDLVGSHGHTMYHVPLEEDYLGKPQRGTLQLGEASVIAQRIGCPVVGDFRVRDMAAGGLGAPLVPYTEYLLYRSESENIALQNIGGIGNITMLPAGCSLEQVYAFDTGPGNMVMDALVSLATDGALRYDDGGRLAAAGRVDQVLLDRLMEDDYLRQPPPKTTGREYYGQDYVRRLVEMGQAAGLRWEDMIATATCFTARTIEYALRNHCAHRANKLIVGGGGSMNPTLMEFLRRCLPECQVLTNEDLGLDSNAKEAVAFAVLANEFCHGIPNNAPRATGAKRPVVMGKLTLA